MFTTWLQWVYKKHYLKQEFLQNWLVSFKSRQEFFHLTPSSRHR